MPAKDDKEPLGLPNQEPARTPEDREQQMIALADKVAEKQLRSGEASSQVITHYLKLGTSMHKLELERARKENLMIEEKIKLMQSQQAADAMMQEVFAAMKRYAGADDDDDF